MCLWETSWLQLSFVIDCLSVPPVFIFWLSALSNAEPQKIFAVLASSGHDVHDGDGDDDDADDDDDDDDDEIVTFRKTSWSTAAAIYTRLYTRRGE